MVKKIDKLDSEKVISKKPLEKPKKIQKPDAKQYPTVTLIDEHEIAMDFANKVYKKFDKMVKSVILFGSSIKHTSNSTSDIDIIILLDDSSIKFDQELMAWYREELGKIVQSNPYNKELHINTVRLITWWQDLLRGDPIVINIIRYGESLIDFGGFFSPLKFLLQEGKIRSTPEAVYAALQRAPQHLMRSKQAEIGAIEGVYWAMVDSAHALLMSAKILPPSPEHIPILLKEHFVDRGILKMKYVIWYRDLYVLHRKIIHGEINDLKGQDIDDWQEKTNEFMRKMAEIIDKIIKAED